MTCSVGTGCVMAALALAAIAGCSNAGQTSGDFTESGDLGTKATYDSDTGDLLVSFAEELDEGQSLYLAIVRGDLKDASLANKDCSLVADQPLAIFGDARADIIGADAREAHGSRTVYRLPVEDASMLVPTYRDESLPEGQSWGDGVPTPEKEAILARGVDVFIDICVTDAGNVLRREQVDFFYAWDQNNPHLIRDAMAADASNASQSADEFNHEQGAVHSPQKYGELCVAALGEIPFFKNKKQVGIDPVTGRPQYGYDTWSCLDSVHIPVTVTTSNGSGETVEGPAWDEVSGGSGHKCDKRQYIYPLCEQGPRVISAKNEQGTHWVLLCRKGHGQTPTLVQDGVDENGKPIMKNTVPEEQLSTEYHDIAMLGHNPRTGRTCFFQNDIDGRIDGAHVPHPADIEKWESMWQGVHGAQGGINCNNCHDNDPFILTPWISGAKRGETYAKAQQIMGAEGKNGFAQDVEQPDAPVVPMIGVHPDFALGDREVPYTLVNFISQNWTHERQLVGDALKGCNNCHRIAAGRTRRVWALRTVGLDTAYNTMISDAYLNDWKRSHYMPMDPRPGQLDPLPGESEWAGSSYAVAIDYIKGCQTADSSVDNGATCQFRDIPREAAGIDPGHGECWSDIPDDCDY